MLVNGGVAPFTLFHGPMTLVADCSVPYGQFKMKLPDVIAAENVAGGLTVTATVPGAEARLPAVAMTLYMPEAFWSALLRTGF